MKTPTIIRTAVIAVAISISNLSFASTPTDIKNVSSASNDTSLCLVVKGKVTKSALTAGVTYTVQLVDNSTVIQSKVVKAGRKFEFKLKKNQWYAVKILKEGCVSKFISITTHNLPEISEEDMYLVNFDLADPLSYDEAKHLEEDAIDFPLAIICYNRTIDSFDYNEEYTKNIKTTLVSSLDNEGISLTKQH